MLKIVESLWAVWAPPRTPMGELTSLPPLTGGRGLLPLPKNPPYPLSAFDPTVLSPTHQKILDTPLSSKCAAQWVCFCWQETFTSPTCCRLTLCGRSVTTFATCVSLITRYWAPFCRATTRNCGRVIIKVRNEVSTQTRGAATVSNSRQRLRRQSISLFVHKTLHDNSKEMIQIVAST